MEKPLATLAQRAWTAAFIWALAGCASIPSGPERLAAATNLARAQGWAEQVLQTETFALMAFAPAPSSSDASKPTEELTIYIEGDGLAWLNATDPSTDPTPRTPVALQLALAQPQGAAAYLARPCQFVGTETPRCAPRYWTGSRFAPEVLRAMDSAVTQLKQRAGAKRVVLAGYSGGAALALLLAARRDDVAAVLTIAGNLDHRAWTELHRVSPLSGSLNPANEISRLRYVPQWHWVGARDSNTTESLARQWVQSLGADAQAMLVVVPEFTHTCCWAEAWPMLWSAHHKTAIK